MCDFYSGRSPWWLFHIFWRLWNICFIILMYFFWICDMKMLNFHHFYAQFINDTLVRYYGLSIKLPMRTKFSNHTEIGISSKYTGRYKKNIFFWKTTVWKLQPNRTAAIKTHPQKLRQREHIPLNSRRERQIPTIDHSEYSGKNPSRYPQS